MRFIIKAAAVICLTLGTVTFAHPGGEHEHELLARRQFLARTPNLRSTCGKRMAESGVDAKAIKRRQGLLKDMRQKRGIPVDKPLKGRDAASVLATDHNETSSHVGVTFDTDPDSFFFADNTSCVLQPATTGAEGPYWVEGEYVRSNLVDDQGGLEIVVDMQIIDINTCEPVAGTYVEFWEANSTGVYSGTSGNGNGNADDLSNFNNTFLRGIQPTDDDGVAQVVTLVPGYFSPRSTHIHLLTHQGATVLENGTLAGGNITHVGQIFFDDTLVEEVNTLYPYNTNVYTLKLNGDDGVFSDEAATSDPVMKYALIGDDLSEGLVTWMTVGIDTKVKECAIPAAYLTEDGGVANPDPYIPGQAYPSVTC